MVLSFTNKVAVITGAGGGLGKTYAVLLASKGAKVVVNDFGGSVKGDSAVNSGNLHPADKVVQEITQKGGTAVANYDSVENGSKIIDTAIKNFGKIDILINNAGILRDISFTKMTDKDFDMVMNIHLKGTFSCCKAAWPYMQAQNYGRIIVTSSASGIFGNFGQVNYSSAKSALLGFGKTLAQEGFRKNIFVNCIAPLAGTRMTQTVMSQDLIDTLKPDYVAPIVGYLVSDKCQENGSVFEIGAGWAAKLRYQRSPGHFFPLNFTVDDVEDSWEKVITFSEGKDNTYPNTLHDSMTLVLTEMMNKGGQTQENNTNSKKIFQMIDAFLQYDTQKAKQIVEKVKCIFEFQIQPTKVSPPSFFYTMDLKNGSGSVKEGQSNNSDAIFTLSDETFTEISTGKLSPRFAVQKGLIKVKGSMSSMMKYSNNLFPPISKEMINMKLEDAVKLYTNKEKSESSENDETNASINELKALNLKAGPIIESIMKQISTPSGKKKIEKVKYVYQLDIVKPNQPKPISFTLDLKSDPPTGFIGPAKKYDTLFTLTDENFVNIMNGKLNPQTAFLQGKMKIKGSMAAAMKFTPNLFSPVSKM